MDSTLYASGVRRNTNEIRVDGCRYLISVENVGFFDFISSALFERVDGRFINTGLYMGRAGCLLGFLIDMYESSYDRLSNQKTWSSYLVGLERQNRLRKDNIKLDKDSTIFLNHSFSTRNKVNLKKKRLYVNNVRPCFIQGNGCENMNKIIIETGYGDLCELPKGFWKQRLKYMYNFTRLYGPIVPLYISVLILAVALVILVLLCCCLR